MLMTRNGTPIIYVSTGESRIKNKARPGCLMCVVKGSNGTAIEWVRPGNIKEKKEEATHAIAQC